MTSTERDIWIDGKSMYSVLCRDIKNNGAPASLKPSPSDYKKLARNLDLTVSYVQKRVEFYLWN